LLSPFFGEFAGTLVVILMGEGVNAAVTLKQSKAEAAGWMVIATGWGFAVFCGVVTAIACGSPGAHLNPAVTVAIAVKTGDFTQLVPFILAQFLGAMAGATLVWLFYFPHWKLTEDPAAKLGVFCTAPAIRSPFWNLLSEIIATAVLIIVMERWERSPSPPPVLLRDLRLIWSQSWFGESGCRWVEPRATPSILREILARGSLTLFCP
jgi:glycerol uptake facilitator protein